MNVIKCSGCSKYIENKGDSYYLIYEYIKGTHEKQCIHKLCYKCYKSSQKEPLEKE